MKKYFSTFVYIFFCFEIFAQSTAVVNGEMRGVWVTTAKMIDYPSQRGLTTEELKEEFLATINMHKENGMNTIFFQVRPAADAFFPSEYEPWSEWLTGVQGKAPAPYFDPLEFMIAETHKLGMEFHAWFNPFRAVATIQYADITENHITKTKPEWFFNYGINKYFNPGIPEVREYLVKIISDVVKRYNIDGVHFDDYFYPYPEKDSNNIIIEIPDAEQYLLYNKTFTNIGDWRRNNINLFVENVSAEIKSLKKDIKFGISPPGVWRNISSDTDGSNTKGLAAYDYIYADALTWLKNKWIDYIVPQLYWHIGHTTADFEILVNWWSLHCYDRDLYIGIGVYNIDATGEKKYWGNPSEVPNQIRLAREYPQVKGFVFYKTQTFRNNPLGINDSLKYNLFKIDEELLAEIDTAEATKYKIVPAPLKDVTPPTIPQNIASFKVKNEFTIFWSTAEEQDFAEYRIYKLAKNQDPELIDKTDLYKTTKFSSILVERKEKFLLLGTRVKFVVTSVDLLGNESSPSEPIFIKMKLK